MKTLEFTLLISCCCSFAFSQDHTVQISPDSIIQNQYPSLHLSPDGKVWVIYLSDSTNVVGGYYFHNVWTQIMSQALPHGLCQTCFGPNPNPSLIEATVDEAGRIWVIYPDSIGIIRVSFFYDGTWTIVDSLGWNWQYSLVINRNRGIWYFYGGGSPDMSLRAKLALGNSILIEQVVVDPPHIGNWDRGPVFLYGSASTQTDSFISTFSYGYRAGLLGSPLCSISFIQSLKYREQIELESGCWDPFSGGTSTVPLLIGTSNEKVLVITKKEQTNLPTFFTVYEVDSTIQKKWGNVIENVDQKPSLDPRFIHQIAASQNSFLMVLTWIYKGVVNVKAFQDSSWFITDYLRDTLGLSGKQEPRIAVEADSTVWLAFSATRGGQRHIFLSRTFPLFVPDTTITNAEEHFYDNQRIDNSLLQNYPNPFNSSTTFQFDLGHTCLVILKIFNLLGEEVSNLVSQVLPAGKHRVVWDPSTLPSGFYVYRLQADTFTETKKLILLR